MHQVAGSPFRQGQHICALYDTREEQLSIAARYIADGLSRDERCLYVAESASALDHFRAQLKVLGVDVDAAEAGAALLLMQSDQAHLQDGAFDSERMLRMLNDSIEKALDDGFAGLRTCGDMSWLADAPPGAQQVMEYEAVLNGLFRHARGLGMCQYDRTRLPADVINRAGIAAHSTVVEAGCHSANPRYDLPSLLGQRRVAD